MVVRGHGLDFPSTNGIDALHLGVIRGFIGEALHQTSHPPDPVSGV